MCGTIVYTEEREDSILLRVVEYSSGSFIILFVVCNGVVQVDTVVVYRVHREDSLLAAEE